MLKYIYRKTISFIDISLLVSFSPLPMLKATKMSKGIRHVTSFDLGQRKEIFIAAENPGILVKDFFKN